MVIVIVPPPYRGPTKGEERVEVRGATARAALGAVDEQFAGFSDQIFEPTGALHRFVKIFRNGDLLDPSQIDAPIGDGDTIEIVAAIAGG